MVSESHPIFAWFSSTFGRFEERGGLAARRRSLLAWAHGRVVEVGAGTGANFVHYPLSVHDVLATEPDPHMFKRLPRAAAAARIPIRLLRAPADELPLEDSWADVVVSTRVLCSVPYQDLVLKEVMRVLKPGGRLLFLEHVRSADERVARRQDRWEPWQVRFAGGCHPNRDTLSAILEAGFEVEHLERADFPGPTITRPHVVGSALKQSVD